MPYIENGVRIQNGSQQTHWLTVIDPTLYRLSHGHCQHIHLSIPPLSTSVDISYPEPMLKFTHQHQICVATANANAHAPLALSSKMWFLQSTGVSL